MGEDINTEISEGKEKPTIIYVKGSQNTIFLEEGIKKFLAHTRDEKRSEEHTSELQSR